VKLYKDKIEHYFYYRTHDGKWYAWEDNTGRLPSEWVLLEPGLHDFYIDEHLQPSNRLEFTTLTGARLRRPYWKVADKWRSKDYAWYTRGK